jgi:hypothetical protein
VKSGEAPRGHKPTTAFTELDNRKRVIARARLSGNNRIELVIEGEELEPVKQEMPYIIERASVSIIDRFDSYSSLCRSGRLTLRYNRHTMFFSALQGMSD